MRTVLITLVLFVALCILMIMNYKYVASITQELLRLADSLDYSKREDCRSAIVELAELWKKSAPIFSLTANSRDQ